MDIVSSEFFSGDRIMSRYWTLSGKPLGGWPDPDTFVLKDAPLAKPLEGQALTRTIYISLDPYQWGYKRRGTEPKGAPCHARTISQVLESRMDGFAAGDGNGPSRSSNVSASGHGGSGLADWVQYLFICDNLSRTDNGLLF